MGYARSKWVTENIVANAASTRGIRAESFRIGQMVGDTEHGVWNETEAISLLIKGAQTVGAMPDLDEVRLRFKMYGADTSDTFLVASQPRGESLHRSC
jgi:thioester reductase-like protein